jgi:hypothetical protein
MFSGFRKSFKVFKSTIHVITFGDDKCAGYSPCVEKPELLLIPKGNPNPIPTSGSLQLRLRKDGLVQLYKKYKMNYITKLEKSIRQSLKNAAQHYQVEDYYYLRNQTVASFNAAIRSVLEETGVEFLGFQVKKYTLPAAQETRMQSVVLRQYEVKVGKQQGDLNKAKAYSDRKLLEYSALTETFQIQMETALNFQVSALKANESLILAETKRLTEEIEYKNTNNKTIFDKETQNMLQKVGSG